MAELVADAIYLTPLLLLRWLALKKHIKQSFIEPVATNDNRPLAGFYEIGIDTTGLQLLPCEICANISKMS